MYFITTIRFNNEGIDDQRTVGFFRSFKDAALCVKLNRCDIFEDGYYQYATITQVDQGLYPCTETLLWYEFDKQNFKGKEISTPDNLVDFRPYIVG